MQEYIPKIRKAALSAIAKTDMTGLLREKTAPKGSNSRKSPKQSQKFRKEAQNNPA